MVRDYIRDYVTQLYGDYKPSIRIPTSQPGFHGISQGLFRGRVTSMTAVTRYVRAMVVAAAKAMVEVGIPAIRAG